MESSVAKPVKKILTHETNYYKIERLIILLQCLHERPYTVKQLMRIMNMSQRSVYRYLSTINQAGIFLDKNFNNEYFIATDNCPICKIKKDLQTSASAAA